MDWTSTWRYKTEEDIVSFAEELKGVFFSDKWLSIDDGRIHIPQQYAWDGCSPSWQMPFGIWIGTWDGPLGIDARPVSWRASLFHDALCQFRPKIYNLKKQNTIDLFSRLLRESNAPAWMCKLYPEAVRRFGPQDWHGDHDYAQELIDRLKSYDHNPTSIRKEE